MSQSDKLEAIRARHREYVAFCAMMGWSPAKSGYDAEQDRGDLLRLLDEANEALADAPEPGTQQNHIAYIEWHEHTRKLL